MMFLESINDPSAPRYDLDVEGDLRKRIAKACPASNAREFRLVIPQQEYDAMMLYHESEFRSFAGYRDPANQRIFKRVLAHYLGVGDVEVRSGIY